MTLIASMVFDSGVLIAADSMGTESSTGNLLHDQTFVVKKLFPIGTSIVWGSAGSGGVAERVSRAFDLDFRRAAGAYTNAPHEVEARCRITVHGVMQAEIAALTAPLHTAMQFGTPPVGQALLFAGVARGAPWISEMLWDGQMTSYAAQGFHAIGSGGLAALTTYKLLEHHGMKTAPISLARTALYRIIDVCIRSNAGGLGPPIRMWEITSTGSREIPDAELTATSDTVGLWEEEERKCLHAVASDPGQAPVAAV